MKNRLVVTKGTVAGDRVGVALGVGQGEGLLEVMEMVLHLGCGGSYRSTHGTKRW